MIVVDTSILIDHLRGEEAASELLRNESRRGRLLAPSLVAWELWKGADTPQRRSDAERLLGSLDIDPLTAAIARLAGELHLDHRQKGIERPAWDLLIAAHAFHHEVPLATTDRDFEAVDGLDLIRVGTARRS